MKQLLLPALLAALLAGCGSTPTSETGGAPVEGRTPGGVTTVTAPEVSGSGLPAELTDPKSVLSKRSVYFDYDKYDVKNEFKDVVAAHAKFLVNNRQFKMLIQGNTDERGSHEYNLSLGQKRADAVKKSLLLLGAKEEQIESVSLGKEKPKAEGHDEAAWTENRRADMLYKGPTGSGEF
ncbi:MAG: OmpA/MotB [Rhodocyclaceae bacterium]|nr:OmpA/MotB [Rhodocyclaceae bacterium]